MLHRRTFLALAPSALLHAAPGKLSAALAQMEKDSGGRLGVSILDTATGKRTGHREDERFPMCSTFKFLLAAAVLQRVDRKQETLDRALAVPPRPLLANSPLTEVHAGGSISISDLCLAILIRSDNTGANLLLETISGPAGMTKFARSIGDTVTRLDRMELELNECREGDPRDTTSPRAMTSNLNTILLGNVLAPASRDQLTKWMEGNLTGLERLRAKLPEGWRAADKTGSNGQHTSNDIAVLWPPNKPPLIVSAYITQCPGPESKRATMLAEIGRLVRESLTDNR